MNTPLYLQIVSDIKIRILKGELTDGMVIPSERRMADLWKVHRNTVTKAYHELKAEGYVSSAQGISYRVTYKGPERRKRIGRVNWEDAIKDEYLDMEHAFDELFAGSYAQDTISFAGGIASPTVYGVKDIQSCYKEILKKQRETAYFFTPYQGDENLRQHICYFLRGKGIRANKGEIQMFSETNQALDFLVTLLLSPGDAVITEEPVSPDVFRPIELAGGKVVTVPVDEEGMICDLLEPLIEKHRPKFIYINSSYQDPTGTVLSLSRRKKLLDLSEGYRIPIIEEDGGSELYFSQDRPPTLKSMEKADNVIYIYSFYLTFIPGAGMAFVAAPKKVLESLRYLVSVRLVSLDWVSQKLLDVAMESKMYDEKLPLFRREYRMKRDKMCRWLDGLASRGVTYRRPEGGVYIWCRLPDEIDVDKLLGEVRRRGVSMMPGKIFYPDRKAGRQYIRLNFSYVAPRDIDTGMQIFTEAILAQ